jgi:hypothetical protein
VSEADADIKMLLVKVIVPVVGVVILTVGDAFTRIETGEDVVNSPSLSYAFAVRV